MRLHYFAASVLPSEEANGVHVVRMGEAFREILDARPEPGEVVLYAQHDGRHDDRQVRELYGASADLRMVRLRTPSIPGLRPVVRALLVLLAHLRRRRPDICYGRDPIALGVMMRLLRAPGVLELHHPPAGRGGDWIARWVLASRQCFGLVTISHALAEDLRTLYDRELGARPIVVAHDGADVPDRCPPQPDNPALTAGYAGSVHAGRGIELIAEVARQRPDIRVRIAGNARRVRDLLAPVGVPENMELVGQLPHHEVAGFLASCDILLAPYQRSVETPGGIDTARWMSPLKMFEYMAAGRPIVCSDLPALRAIVPDEDTVVFADPEDGAAWSQALADLRDPTRRADLGRKAFALVQGRYSWRRRAEFLLHWSQQRLSKAAR
jgi:glycosyltransferase involved in cell wall biosynthesis